MPDTAGRSAPGALMGAVQAVPSPPPRPMCPEALVPFQQAKHRQVAWAAAALAQHQLPSAILLQLSRENDELYRQALHYALSAVEAHGGGKPPVEFAVIVTGSAGRLESLLGPDQDNGFVIADYPDALYPVVNAYFYHLAEQMTQALDAIGIPFCIGHVMATNVAWRKRLSEWQQQMALWLRRPSPASTTLLDIWIDFRGVCGTLELVDELRTFITDLIPRYHGFLRELESLQYEHDIAIGLFRTFKREHQPGLPGHRQLDIKRKGLRPLIEGIRLLALREGIPAPTTLHRLAILHQRGVIAGELAAAANESFECLAGLLLQAQIQADARGEKPGAYVNPDALTAAEQKRLKTALRTVKRIRDLVHAEWTAEWV